MERENQKGEKGLLASLNENNWFQQTAQFAQNFKWY